MPYEYMPPHGRAPAPVPQWEVVIPWGSSNVIEKVSAPTASKALNKVAMKLARDVNMMPRIVFQRLHSEKRYTVTPVRSSFATRAGDISSLDKERLRRLPKVVGVVEHEDSGDQITYLVLLQKGNSMVDLRVLTADIQNLFGVRLRSSGPTQVTEHGSRYNAVKVRISTSPVES